MSNIQLKLPAAMSHRLRLAAVATACWFNKLPSAFAHSTNLQQRRKSSEEWACRQCLSAAGPVMLAVDSKVCGYFITQRWPDSPCMPWCDGAAGWRQLTVTRSVTPSGKCQMCQRGGCWGNSSPTWAMSPIPCVPHWPFQLQTNSKVFKSAYF